MALHHIDITSADYEAITGGRKTFLIVHQRSDIQTGEALILHGAAAAGRWRAFKAGVIDRSGVMGAAVVSLIPLSMGSDLAPPMTEDAYGPVLRVVS